MQMPRDRALQTLAGSVIARVEDGELRIEVCDDGVGGARGHHTTGLGGLEDRMSALGGRLLLESPPGKGTRVCAQLPVSGPSGEIPDPPRSIKKPS